MIRPESGIVPVEHVQAPIDGVMILPHYGVPRLHFNDLDDNLIDTNAALEGLYAICREERVDHLINDAVVTAGRKAERLRGGSLDVLQLMDDHLDPALAEIIRERFRKGEHSNNMLFPDGLDYMQELAAYPATPNLIVTYGKNVHTRTHGGWQGDKVQRAIALGMPPAYAYYMPHSKKGPVIDTLRTVTGNYTVVGLDAEGLPAALYTAESAVLTDDRLVSLVDTPENCEPVHMIREDVPEATRNPEISRPARIRPVKTFGEVTVSKEVWPMNEYAQQAPPPHIARFVPVKLLFDQQVAIGEAAA